MKSQMLKKSVLLNLALPAVMLLAFAATAHAQDANGYGVQASGPNGMLQAKDAADQKSIKQYINRRETDDQYQKAIHEQPSAKGATDPWGNVRPTTTPATPAVKSAAKTATGGKFKPVGGAAKPTVDNAASATSAAPKN
jgi:hypothetical protein